MVVELISVGTEILLGHIVNSNAAYLAEKCSELGFYCNVQTVVGKNKEHLKIAVQTAIARSKLVILTGGLGTMPEDVTKEAVVELFDRALISEEPVMIQNEKGTASGLILKKEETYIVLLPGTPSEMEFMFEEKVIPYLKKMTSDLQYSEIQIGSEVKEDIYTKEHKKPLEQIVVEQLIQNKLSIATAESCTGGLLAGRLINVSGVSSILKEGYITYSNEAKSRLIKVREQSLIEFGAVSKEVAKEMAEGTAKVSGADITVAITGIAGPEGGTIEKPVGLVYIACYMKGNTIVEQHYFSGNRSKIREATVLYALDLINKTLLKYLDRLTENGGE